MTGKPKKPKAPITVALTAPEREVVYSVGYYAVLDPAMAAAALDREPDDGIKDAVRHLRAVMDLYDQLGWQRDDEREAFKIKAPWLFLMEILGAIERDLANSLTKSLRGVRWSRSEFSFNEERETSVTQLKELGIVTNLIRRIGGRWKEETPHRKGKKREYDFREVLVDKYGESCGSAYDRLRSEKPLLNFAELFEMTRETWLSREVGSLG